ncbi:uncharacterized protein LOC106073812 isoform X1 [Biomphalaria glabrata]|uniref:Uncharacterized protein LOC106073812 isoform X1 n=1 Tax=Biomphalaria glabrata TaxID=6526 RepID=A0A9U8EJP4_BIOGL|nr:uncharacterized protein LOC106073812 isoform X1 [Biomphalaria glabrata]
MIDSRSMSGLSPLFVVCCLLTLTVTSQQAVSTTPQSTTDSGPSGIEKQVLGPLRVWHIVAIVCTVVLTGLVIFCYCYDYRIPRSRTEIEENHKKRQMNKKYLFLLEKRPDDVLTKPKDPPVLSLHTRTTAPKTISSSNARPNATNNVRAAAQKKAPNTRSDALNKVRNAVRATSHSKSATESNARSIRSREDPDYFSSAVKPRPKTGLETPLASHPKDLLSLMNQMKKKPAAARQD